MAPSKFCVRALLLLGSFSVVGACGGSQPGATGAEATGPSGGSGSDPEALSAEENALVESSEFLAPAPGTRGAETRFATIDFELTLLRDGSPAGMQGGRWSLDEKRSYEVDAVEGKAISGLKVAFGTREGGALLGLENHAATAGKSFVLRAKGGALEMKGAEGGEVSSEEREGLGEYDWVGKPSPLLVWLSGGKLAAGERRKGEAKHARLLIGDLPGVDPKKTTLQVTSQGEEAGALRLDVEATVVIVSGPTILSLNLTGPARIDRKTGLVTELSLSGTVKPSGTLKTKKGELDLAGKGKAEVKRKIDW